MSRTTLSHLAVLVASLTALMTLVSACARSSSAVCADGRRCPSPWQCAAAQDICIEDSCGNGKVDDGEGCDDGNVMDQDGCNAFCEPELYPYLQLASPNSVHVLWTTLNERETALEWGSDPELGDTAQVSTTELDDTTQLHEAQLTNLTPGAAYYYKVTSGSLEAGPFRFRAPSDAGSSQPDRVRLIVLGNTQGDGPVYGDTIDDGVMAYLADESSTDSETLLDVLADELAMVLVPGNFTRPAADASDLLKDFFRPGKDLMARVPFYPVMGTSENASTGIDRYFRLPGNGKDDLSEEFRDTIDDSFIGRWWSFDHGNVRIIGLDSNLRFQALAQEEWLRIRLQEAIDDEAIDFAIVQVHHAFFGGDTENSGEFITAEFMSVLDEFSDPDRADMNGDGESDYIPIVHFTAGSEHGYVRGQSFESAHLWVDVSAAGGPLTPPDGPLEGDPDLVVVEQSQYGFVVIDVTDGPDATLRLRRINEARPGGPEEPGMDGDRPTYQVGDEISLRSDNSAPDTPTAVTPNSQQVRPECARLQGSPLSDVDGDELFASQWQISASCLTDFDEELVLDTLVLDRPLVSDGTDAPPLMLNTIDVPILALTPDVDYCWRARYRDSSLRWSDWSASVDFTVAPRMETVMNLLENPSAEDPDLEEVEEESWTLLTGEAQRRTSSDCPGLPEAYDGSYFFAVGGVCEASSEVAVISQLVDVSGVASPDEIGLMNLGVSARVGTRNGADEAIFQVAFYDGDLRDLGESPTVLVTDPIWNFVVMELPIPSETQFIEVTLGGERTSSEGDNNVFFDALDLRVMDKRQCVMMPAPGG